MEKKYNTVTFLNSIKDTFPYIESTIMILDNNLHWWKLNNEVLEKKIANVAAGIANKPVKIEVRFMVYNGPDENVESVKWSGPALEFTFVEKSTDFVKDIKDEIGNTWEGHKLIIDDNKLIIMFE